jgi:hypothetical protein
VDPAALVPADVLERYEVWQWRNACAVLATARPAEWDDLLAVLRGFQLRRSDIEQAGGRKSPIAEALDHGFYSRGWAEKGFDTRIVVDGVEHVTPTHGVDCFKNRVALEVEWNNKDPFYDRDLNNFRLLFDLRAIDVGVIITRCDELQDVFDSLGDRIRKKYGASTTHMGRLVPRLEGGGGGGCPVLVVGIRRSCYVPTA